MISLETRRNIFTHLKMEEIHWSGRISDIEFLSRLYDLKKMPSHDSRFETAYEDIWQHTENNFDYQGNWVFEDDRFNLKSGTDEHFLKFICEIVHPLVLPLDQDANQVVKIFNDWLRADGWEIVGSEKRGEMTLFLPQKVKAGKIDDRYEIIRELENQGGMGFVAFAVDHMDSKNVVIKLFKEDGDEEDKKRFIREVRLLLKYGNSGFVVPILDSSLENERPYFVMPEAQSDLVPFSNRSLEELEPIIIRMIDCVHHIHEMGDLHRDIKPENFLYLDGKIYLSDLGLAKDPSSQTQFTKSIHVAGTREYSPPDFFIPKGFKNPTIQDDIFSLGKTIYFLLTGVLPHYIVEGNIPTSIFSVIQKATNMKREQRYDDCLKLKNDIIGAFDIALDRDNIPSNYYLYRKNISGLDDSQLQEFIDLLKNKSIEEKIEVFSENQQIFKRIAQSSNLLNEPAKLITIYREIKDHVYRQKYWPFSYAEEVASSMSYLFNSSNIDSFRKADALELAMDFSIRMNRGAAGRTTAKMIESIVEDSLAMPCLVKIKMFGANFVIENCVKASNCRNIKVAMGIESLLAQWV